MNVYVETYRFTHKNYLCEVVMFYMKEKSHKLYPTCFKSQWQCTFQDETGSKRVFILKIKSSISKSTKPVKF